MISSGKRCLLTLVLVCLAPTTALGQRPATPVRVEPVETRTLQARRLVTGELRAHRRSDVAAQEPGLVVELSVREGQVVEAGDLLATLDSRRLDIQLAEIEADMKSAEAIKREREAELDWRNRDLELLRSSFERGAANPRELLDAESQVAVAAARVVQSSQRIELDRARARLLRERLADMRIAAPFRGVIVARHVELGEWLGEGDPVVELLSADPVEAWLDVPQRLFETVVSESRPVAVELDASGRAATSTTQRVIPVVDPDARSFTLVVTIANEQGRMSPGMSVTAWLPTGSTAEYLTVPKNAILRNDAGPFVYVSRAAAEGSQAVPMPIDVLFGQDDRVAVRAGGLRDGDLVVVEGNERLFPMMPIAPRGDAAAASPSDADGGASP